MEGQVQKFLLGIVAVILLLSVIGATIGTIDTASDNVGVVERCGDAGCFYNTTRGGTFPTCTTANITNDPNSCGTIYQSEFSGETLFSGGLLTTIVILVCFMVIVGAAWINFKNK